MEKGDRISLRQLGVLIFVSLLAPMIRILPVSAVMISGKAAWLTPLPALAVGCLFLWGLKSLIKNVPSGIGLAGISIRCLGKVGGRVFCVIFALWLTFYAGFLARSASERIISAIFPNGTPPILVLVTLSAALLAAWGSVRSLARAAELFMPLVLTVLTVITLSASSQVDLDNLLPVTYLDTGKILLGALPTFDVISLSVVFLFLVGKVERRQPERPFHWLLILTVSAMAVIIVTVGSTSPQLCVRLQNAFFAVIRDVQVLGLLERIESVVVAIWIVTDFTVLSALFIIVSEIWRSVFLAAKRTTFIIPSGALSAAAAFLIAPNAFQLLRWSRLIVPAANLFMTVLLTPLVLIIGKLRKKI